MTNPNMENGNGKIIPEETPQKPEAQEKIKELKLTITKNLENGQLSVQGPGNGQLYDRWVCNGLLDDAKDFIKSHNAGITQSNIVKSNFSMTQQIRGMFRRH